MERITTKWQSPSNIAIVKYWGKKENQIPANPSISFTLDSVYTTMEMILEPKKSNEAIEVEFYFDNKPNKSFEPKIIHLLSQASIQFDWILKYRIIIYSSNNFPHGTGIASSASSMSALSLCICDISKKLEYKFQFNDFYLESSYWSRIGSGSACRSIFGGFVSWGKSDCIEDSSDLFASPLKTIHPNFEEIFDYVLIADGSEKSVSSTKGHAMLNEHWYAEKRYEEANLNTCRLMECLKNGDRETFGQIAEKEALSLHAMMLTSNPGYFLVKANTLKIIEKIREFRNKNKVPLFFTLDAGPNVHLLFFKDNFELIDNWVKKELVVYCSNQEYFCNKIGNGPKKIIE